MRRLLGFVLSLAMAACHGDRDAPAPPSSASASAPAPAPEIAPVTCLHRRPFSDSDKPLVLPAPFDAGTPCDILEVLPGHAEKTKVRIDRVHLWNVRGRTLLAVLYYRGADAEARVLGDTYRVAVHLALVEKKDAKVALVAEAKPPWQPKADQPALAYGRSDFDTEVAFDASETMLAVKTPWSTGAPGSWTMLTLYKLAGDEPKIVLEHVIDWAANGNAMEDDDEVSSAITSEARPQRLPEGQGEHVPEGAPNDLVVKTVEQRCKRDYGSFDAKPICRAPQKIAAERWRFDDAVYARTEGKDPPLPKVLHKLWGY